MSTKDPASSDWGFRVRDGPVFDLVNLAQFGQLERPVGNLNNDFFLPPFCSL
jgi:hypothetical protein